jgi:hypothetical protein
VSAGAQQYLCPACGFRIFNRRYPRCEACGQDLPQSLLLSPEDRQALDAEHEKSRRERERVELARRRRKSGNVSDTPIYYGDFGGGADTGGGDCTGGGGSGHH